MSGFGRVGHNHIMQIMATQLRQNSQKEKLGVSEALFFFFKSSSHEDVKTKLFQKPHLFPDVVLEENPMRLKLKYKSL